MRTVRLLTILASLPVLFSFNSCFLADRIEGNGNMKTETRTMDASFNQISLSSDFTVYIVKSDENKIIVEAESNLMEYIYTDVRSNDLSLRTPNNTWLDPRRDIIITIYTDNEINDISISGSGYIEADTIDASTLQLSISGSGDMKIPVNVDRLKANISGSGNINVWGYAPNAEYDISGSGDIKAIGVETKTCDAHISGSGDITVYVTDRLNVHISGSGSVYYEGNPLIDADISGSGGVHPK
jgi:hypothetical protein